MKIVITELIIALYFKVVNIISVFLVLLNNLLGMVLTKWIFDAIIVSDDTVSERFWVFMTESKRRAVAELLGNIPLFNMLDRAELLAIVDRSHISVYRTGEVIGDASEPCLPVIISGKAAVLGKDAEKGGVVLRVLGEGSVFGVSQLFSDRAGAISTVRAEKETEAILIPQSAVSELIHGNGDFAEGYIRFLGGKIRFLGSRIESFTAGSAEARLARYLFSLKSEDMSDGGELELTLECSLSRLADMLNIGRASLYRAINTLEEKGVISHTDRHISIKDVSRLSEWF